MMKKAREIFKTLSAVLISVFILGAILIAAYADSKATCYEYYATMLFIGDCAVACAAGVCYFISKMLQ